LVVFSLSLSPTQKKSESIMLRKWLRRVLNLKAQAGRHLLRPHLNLEALENRVVPVIGANIEAAVVEPGTYMDGVVQLIDPTQRPINQLMGSGAELFDTRHILTAAHVVGEEPGAFIAHQVVFNMVRSDGVPAPIPVSIRINVPAGAAYQQVPSARLGLPDALVWKQAQPAVNDIALDTLTDQEP